MKTIFYVGKAYPHLTGLLKLKSAGYSLGLFQDRSQQRKNIEVFDHVVPLDFDTEAAFIASLESATDIPHINGLVCSHENYIIFKSLAAEILHIPSLSIESARAATDKYIMRQRFLNYNPSITPRFSLIESTADLLAFAKTATYPLIMKPTNLVKSLLITKCDTEEELLSAYANTLDQIDLVYKQQGVTNRIPGIVVEEFITGKLCSVVGFADQSGALFTCDGIVELVTALEKGFDDNFLYSRSITNTLSTADREMILAVAREGMKALSLRSTSAHIEIIYSEHGAKLVEIGARIGGYRPFLYEHSYGISLLEQEAAVAVGEQPNLRHQFKKYSAMYELFAKRPGEFIRLDGINEPRNYEYFHQVASPGKYTGSAKNGHKAATIIGIADHNRDAFNKKATAISTLTVITK
ncbi:ATP-grasp domain-containing protein [Candidatus Saccharibacteria bacterium]|nr:ATP-grasp domain-containing protein [Candidatus Saccharibacteria bacterium]